MIIYSIEASVYRIIAIAIATVILIALVKISTMYRGKIKFFITGLDSKFSLKEISLLWRVSKICGLDEPMSLFWSLPSLTRCISQIKSNAAADGTENSSKIQNLLTKLYEYRNKIEKDADKKKGLDSTRSLDNGQKIRIIYPGKGVFSSEIVNNARELTIKIPTQNNQIVVEGKEWIGKTVSVYLWKKGDARYVFDTDVTGEGLFLGKTSLYLRHTDKLLRTQKRNAVRAKCNIYASLYIIREKVVDYNIVEAKPGYRCLLEDISEAGALIRIGGKGAANIQIKLQFNIENKLVVMFGVIRTVEFNEQLNQSRLHFECIHIDPVMKNQILSFVYNIMPEKDKEIYDALSLTDEDQKISEGKSDADIDGAIPQIFDNEKKSSDTPDFPDEEKIPSETDAEEETVADDEDSFNF